MDTLATFSRRPRARWILAWTGSSATDPPHLLRQTIDPTYAGAESSIHPEALGIVIPHCEDRRRRRHPNRCALRSCPSAAYGLVELIKRPPRRVKDHRRWASKPESLTWLPWRVRGRRGRWGRRLELRYPPNPCRRSPSAWNCSGSVSGRFLEFHGFST